MPPRPSRLRHLAVNLVVLLIGIIAAGLLFEVLLRVHNPFLTRIKRDRVVLLANRQVRFRTRGTGRLDPVVTITLNALGFRGPNPPPDFARHLTLIAIGGSTTQCALQSDDKTWPAVLGKRLQRSFRDVWINDAGIAGHTTYGHLVILHDYVASLHPKLALFLVGINDAAKASDPQWDFDAEQVKSPIMFGSPKAFLKSASAYSEVAALCTSLWRQATASRAGLGFGRIGGAQLGGHGGTAGEERRRFELATRARCLRDYADRLKGLLVTARAAGIEPVLLTQPSLVATAVDDRGGADLAKARDAGRGRGETLWDALEIYNDVTRRVCLENDVLLVDLARQVPKSPRYFADLVHFNDDGAILVAEIIDHTLCPEIARRYPQFVTRACSGPAIAATRGSACPARP